VLSYGHPWARSIFRQPTRCSLVVEAWAEGKKKTDHRCRRTRKPSPPEFRCDAPPPPPPAGPPATFASPCSKLGLHRPDPPCNFHRNLSALLAGAPAPPTTLCLLLADGLLHTRWCLLRHCSLAVAPALPTPSRLMALMAKRRRRRGGTCHRVSWFMERRGLGAQPGRQEVEEEITRG
jgi:hypothetical protein